MVSDKGILYIEPRNGKSAEPVIDELTRKMAAALRQGIRGIDYNFDGNFKPGNGYRGFHVCRCGAMSSNSEHRLPSGELTNSLCVHYLAFHREEVPPAQIAKVAALDCGEVEPTQAELGLPSSSPTVYR